MRVLLALLAEHKIEVDVLTKKAPEFGKIM